MATEITDPTADLLNKVVGSQTTNQGTSSLDVNNIVNGVSSQTNNTTGSTNTANQSTSTQDINANITALQDVYAKQAAGVTPDMLKAIFTEGSKQVPGLVASTANAVGARSNNNDPLATALTELNTNLTSQAATLNTKMLSDSANTANQIAELTKSINNTSSGNQSQNTQQSGSQSGTQSQNQNTQSDKTDNNLQRSTINTHTGGQLLMASLLASLFGGGGLGGLFGGSGGSNPLMGLFGKLFGGAASGGTDGTDWLSQFFNNPAPTMGGSVGDLPLPGDLITNTPDWTDLTPPDPIGGFPFRDGGLVPTPGSPKKLSGSKGVVRKYADGGVVINDNALVKAPQLSITDPKQQKNSNSNSSGAATDGMTGLDLTSLLGALAGSVSARSGGGKSSGGGSAGTPATQDGGNSGTNAGNATPAGGFNVGNLAGFTNNPASSMAINGLATAALGPLGMFGAKGLNALLGMIDQQTNQTMLDQQEQEAMAYADAHESTGPAATATPADASVANMFGLDPSSIGLAGNMGMGDSSASANEGSGATGDGGIGGASGDGPGFADGGKLAGSPSDPKGVKDKINAKLSGGEYIIPKDVVDLIGSQFFDNLKTMFHTPAAMQEEEMAEGEQ